MCGKESGVLGQDSGALGGEFGAAAERARALARHLRDFHNDLVPWVEKNGRLPRVQWHRCGAQRDVGPGVGSAGGPWGGASPP